MKHVTVDLGELFTGDCFYFAKDPSRRIYGPVLYAEANVYGGFTLTYATDDPEGSFHPGARIVVTYRAPNCRCGTHIEFCDRDCDWPAELAGIQARFRADESA